MNRPNPTKPQQFENKKKQKVIGKRSISSLSTHQLTLSEAAGVDIRFWKALAQGGGGQTWHNFNLTYCLSTCPVINTIYTMYCAIINVKIQKYIF